MRGIVKSRPFVKRTRRGLSSGGTLPFVRGRRRGKDQPSFFSSFFKKWGLIGLIILLTSVLIVFLLRGTRYNPTYLIKTIEYSQETRAKYWNTELFVLASKFLRGKYYNTLRIGGDGKLLERVRQEYPFTKSAHITFLGNQKVKVDFDFYSPEFLVKLWEKKFLIRHDILVEHPHFQDFSMKLILLDTKIIFQRFRKLFQRWSVLCIWLDLKTLLFLRKIRWFSSLKKSWSISFRNLLGLKVTTVVIICSLLLIWEVWLKIKWL